MKKINKQKKAIPSKVTEHRKIMKKLRESKELFQKIFEEGPIGMAIIGKDYRLLDVNNRFCQMVGYTKNELTKLTFVDITHPEDIDKDTRLAEKVFKGEIPFYRMEKRYIKKNKKIIWINLTASVIRDKKGKPIYGLTMVEDITKRKKAEEALKESEERFRQIAENAQDWIWEVNADGLYTYASPIVEKMLGYKPKEIVGKKHFYDLFHPDDRKEMKKAAFEAFAKKKPFREFLNRNIHKNGKEIWLSTSGVPMLDEKRSLLGYRGADTDITERKRAEDALRQERDRAQKYLDIAGVIIVAINTKGEITLINKKGCEILGYKQEEIIGKNWFDNFLPERLRKEVRVVSQKLLVGKIEPVEYYENPVLTKHGEERIIAWHNIALRDEIGNIIGHLSSGEDITERKKAEEKLMRLVSKLKEKKL